MTQSYGYTENLSILVIRFFFNPDCNPVDSPLQLRLGPLKGQRLSQAQSALNVAADEDNLSTDDEIKSEPHGKTPKEKPNYYFEYKRQQKQFMVDSEASSCDVNSKQGSSVTLHEHDSKDTLDGDKTCDGSYLLAVKGEMSASDLVEAGYNTSEYYNRHCGETVRVSSPLQ